MPRRRAGLILVAVVLLATALSARWAGTRVAGTAVPMPGVGAPTVGDCLAFVDQRSVEGSPAIGLTVDSVGQSAVRFSDCATLHQGGVVAYRAELPATQPTGPDVSDGQWCRQVAAGYRAHANWLVREVAAGLWAPVTGQRFVTVLSVPSADPYARRWAACAVLSPGLENYGGSYIASLADAPAAPPPPPFGGCRLSRDIRTWISSTDPHNVQVFGTATVIGAPTARLRQSCGELIARMTDQPDVTAAGRLRLEVVTASQPAADRWVAVTAGCRLTAHGGR